MPIGTAVLEHLDPPMGVAFGAFSPSSQYNPNIHANTVEGEYLGDRGKSLTASDDRHFALETASIAIQDFAELGRELTLFFRDGETSLPSSLRIRIIGRIIPTSVTAANHRGCVKTD